MYISQIKVDCNLRSAQRALSSPQVLHAIVENCFDTSEKKLWRIDEEKLLVVSSESPSDPDVFLQLSTKSLLTKDYEGHLASIKAGYDYCFRLTANPVRSISSERGKRGKVYAHATIEQQMDWLRAKASKLGFTLNEFHVSSSQVIKFHKAGHEVTLKLATFEGMLTVENCALLRDAMVNGIGRAKAYGAGLITLMP